MNNAATPSLDLLKAKGYKENQGKMSELDLINHTIYENRNMKPLRPKSSTVDPISAYENIITAHVNQRTALQTARVVLTE